MPIDFQDRDNRYSYAGRVAEPGWGQAMRGLVDPAGKRVADIGCGGGIYSLAWKALGAVGVVGIDFSESMLQAARESAHGEDVRFQHGHAEATGLPDASVDVVFQRALIHHLDSYDACFREASRILSQGGRLIVQDRCLADVAIPGSSDHVRGYFFERFPSLLAIERRRRPNAEDVTHSLVAAGFVNVEVETLWEVRRSYAAFDALAQDLMSRTGRSILHDLTDDELGRLVDFIGGKLANVAPIVERDRWTLWSATRPDPS